MGGRGRGSESYDNDGSQEVVDREQRQAISAHRREAAEGDLLDEIAGVEGEADQATAQLEQQRQLDAAHRREASEADLLDASAAVDQETEPRAPSEP